MATGQSQEQADLEARDPDVRRMLRVRDDVPGAFEELVVTFQARLLGVLTHLIGKPDEAEDLAQEVFLRIYKARKGYRPTAKFSTWLFTIANNVALNYLRGKGRSPTVALDANSVETSALSPLSASLASRDATASAQMRKVELADVIREAMEELGEDQRMAVLLNKFEEMSYSDIAEVMGRTEPAIKSLLARARNNLREKLEPYLRTGQRGG